MIYFEYELVTYEALLYQLAAFLAAEVVDNVLHFPSSFADGYMKLIKLPGGLEVLINDFTLKQDFLTLRKKNDLQYCTLVCNEITNVEEFTMQIGSDMLSSHEKSKFGIFLTSFLFDQKLFLNAGATMRGIRVFLTLPWMRQYLRAESMNAVLEKYLQMKTAGAFLIKTDIEYKDIINQLLSARSADVTMLFYKNRVLEMLEKFFDKLYNTMQAGNEMGSDGISEVELERVVKAGELITSDFSQPLLTIPQISRKVGMSESKFKILFKKIFGTSPYQYFQHARMEMAHTMLISGGKSISEIGFELGYSNLSAFSTAFKKQFSTTPSALIIR